MNSQENIFNAQFDDTYIFSSNVEYAVQQQTQQQNTQYHVNNQIYPPQVEHMPNQQVYQPNIAYQVDQQINKSNTEYQAYNQFYQPNAELNLEKKTFTPLPRKGKGQRTRTTYTDEQIKNLDEHFQKNPYITRKKKKELAVTLGMEELQIQKWYQNRRTKEGATAKRKANCREGTENLRLPSQSIRNVLGDDHQINLNPTNSSQYNNMYPGATSREAPFYVNRTQNLGEPNEIIQIWGPQNLNNYYAYYNPEVYENNLIQSSGVTLSTLLENFRPTPKQNYQNILNKYKNYGTNRNENLTQSFDAIPDQPLENHSRLLSLEEHLNIFKNAFLPYNNEHE